MDRLEKVLRINNKVIRATIAEFVGTTYLVYVGTSAGTAYFLYGGDDECSASSKVFASTFSGGIALIMAIICTVNVSGAHLNPAVTLAMAAAGAFPWYQVPLYFVAQYLGAFLAAALMWATYHEAIMDQHDLIGNDTLLVGGHPHSTGPLFYSGPAPHSTLVGATLNHFMAAMSFLMAIAAITDKRNIRMPAWMQPVAIGMALMCLCQAFGANAGAVLNPAADFAPRLFASFAGWGPEVFDSLDGTYWWLCGIIAPHAGAILGVLTYRFLIGAHCRSPLEDEMESEEGHELNSNIKFIGARKA